MGLELGLGLAARTCVPAAAACGNLGDASGEGLRPSAERRPRELLFGADCERGAL